MDEFTNYQGQYTGADIDDAVTKVKGGAAALGAAPAYTTKSMNDCTTLKEIFDLFGYNYSVRLTGGIGQQEATNLRTLLGSELGVAFHTNYLGVRAELVSDRTILLTAVDATSGDDIADGYIYFNAQMTVGNWTGWRTSDYRIVDGVVEWFNPPMELGVEYRTTERFWGAPVYVKLIRTGYVTGGTELVLDHGIDVFDVVDVKFYNGLQSVNSSIVNYSAETTDLIATRSQIRATSTTSLGSTYVLFKYTKSTD